jgi:hypothetical protein
MGNKVHGFRKCILDGGGGAAAPSSVPPIIRGGAPTRGREGRWGTIKNILPFPEEQIAFCYSPVSNKHPGSNNRGVFDLTLKFSRGGVFNLTLKI